MTQKVQRRVTAAPLKDVVIFTLPITLWSGRGKLGINDLGIDESKLPPETLASLGSKRLMDKKALKPLDKCKREMHRALASVGLRFLNGYALSKELAVSKAKELDALVRKGNKAKQEFLDSFVTEAASWQRENKEWAHIIRASLPSRDKVAERIKFDWQCMAAVGPDHEALKAKLEGEAAGLSTALWVEIEDEASDFVKKSFADTRNEGTQRTITPVKRMVTKLDRLSFLDHRVGPLVDVLNTIINSFPTKGKIRDQQFLDLMRVGALLADRARMQEIGQKAFDGEEIDVMVKEVIGHDLTQMLSPNDELSGTVVPEKRTRKKKSSAKDSTNASAPVVGLGVFDLEDASSPIVPNAQPDHPDKVYTLEF